MGKRLTSQEVLDRQDFVLEHISQGIPRREIHGLIKVKFEVCDRAANNIYNIASNCPKPDSKEHRLNRVITLKAFAGQIRSAHADMDMLEELIKDAKNQPGIKLTAVASIIGQKNQVRAQLGKTLSDMARIFGLYNDMPLLQAINIMAASEILPPELANKMLEAIEDISTSIEQSMQKKETTAEPINDDFEIPSPSQQPIL